VAAISRRLAVSERHLRRRFLTAVGYGPKTLDRVLRLQRFLALAPRAAAGPGGLAGLAAEVGYADQPHLSRDCARLAGVSPRTLAAEWGRAPVA
jgi:transcriptional regulator GlxA family with amidase domain